MYFATDFTQYGRPCWAIVTGIVGIYQIFDGICTASAIQLTSELLDAKKSFTAMGFLNGCARETQRGNPAWGSSFARGNQMIQDCVQKMVAFLKIGAFDVWKAMETPPFVDDLPLTSWLYLT